MSAAEFPPSDTQCTLHLLAAGVPEDEVVLVTKVIRVATILHGYNVWYSPTELWISPVTYQPLHGMVGEGMRSRYYISKVPHDWGDTLVYQWNTSSLSEGFRVFDLVSPQD